MKIAKSINSNASYIGVFNNAFGMQLQNRHSPTADYRYGFQGQEGDPEVKDEGNSVNYKYRMHDPRLGRFFAIDPLANKYPYYTPYSFSGNKVIHAIELEGLEEMVVIVRPSQTDPKLQVLTVYKVNDVGPLCVTYHHLNSDGEVISSEDPILQFKPNTAEAIGMNAKYKKTGKTLTEAMDVSSITISKEGLVNVTQVKRIDDNSDGSSLTGATFLQYDLTIYFNTDKSTLDAVGVRNYDNSMEQIESLKTTLGTEISYAGPNGSVGKLEMKGFQMIVTGETDSRQSNYANSEGEVCGNTCLAQDRANSVLNSIQSSHPNNNSTRSINHTGSLDHDDRKSSVMFIPSSVKIKQ